MDDIETDKDQRVASETEVVTMMDHFIAKVEKLLQRIDEFVETPKTVEWYSVIFG